MRAWLESLAAGSSCGRGLSVLYSADVPGPDVLHALHCLDVDVRCCCKDSRLATSARSERCWWGEGSATGKREVCAWGTAGSVGLEALLCVPWT